MAEAGDTLGANGFALQRFDICAEGLAAGVVHHHLPACAGLKGAGIYFDLPSACFLTGPPRCKGQKIKTMKRQNKAFRDKDFVMLSILGISLTKCVEIG